MTPASSIKRLGNSPDPQGNKLQARFPAPSPVKIQVKGTNDISLIKGDSGNWISVNKYTSLQLTLIVFDADGNTQEFNYDINGNLISDCITDFVSVSAFIDSAQKTNNVLWSISFQKNLSSFDVLRSGTETGIYTKINSDPVPFAGDSDYGYVDLNPLKLSDHSVADNYYKISANCQVGGATISNFAKAQ